MGAHLRETDGRSRGNGPAAARWFLHHQFKKPFFGCFMKPWRWPADAPREGWQALRIRSGSHSELAAVLHETAQPQALGVVVCAHPMGMAAKGFWLRHGHARALLEAGFHVLAFDFNGFGESPSTNFDWPADAIAVGCWARERFPGLPVHALCASFGAIHTLNAIDDPAFPYDAVVAEGCPPSLPQFWKAYPFAHAVLVAGSRLNPAGERRLRPVAHLPGARAGVRLLLIHSERDRWTPVAFGDELANAAPATLSLQRLTLTHADHTHGMRDEPDIYWPAVRAFLSSTSPTS